MSEEAAALALAKAMPAPNNTDELRATLQKQLRVIVDRPLTPASLRELSEVAVNAQQLLVSLEAPQAMPGQRRGGGGITSIGGVYSASDGFEPLALGGNAAETFGSSALRELSSGINKSKPLEIIRAIAEAQKLGLDESIIDDLKSELPGYSETVTSIKPKTLDVSQPSESERDCVGCGFSDAHPGGLERRCTHPNRDQNNNVMAMHAKGPPGWCPIEKGETS